MSNFFTNFIDKIKTDVAAGKVWAVYVGGVGKAVLHGGWSSITAALSASMLDYAKFNLTSGLKSEFDLLAMVFLSSGALAGYLYVKTNKPPTVKL